MTYFKDVSIVHGLSAAGYFARPEVSRSELVRILQAPARVAYEKANPRPPTPAMVFGSMVHSVVLTPDEFDNEFLVSPELSRRTKNWKADAEEAEKQGLTAVLLGDAAKARDCAKSAAAAFPSLLDACKHEVAIFGTHIETGIGCKARLDLLADTYCGDLKTTKDANEEAFGKSVGNFRYDIQDAFYGDLAGSLRGVEHLPMVFACIETEPPYLTAEWDLSEEWIENGRAGYEEALRLYAKYEAEGYPKTLGKGTLEPRPWQVR
tara:strand:+ start:1920 stop:2711 length:792 start_codon:yes stop_codon:yes gene_type:complete